MISRFEYVFWMICAAIFMLIISEANASVCERNPIYCKIIKLSPKIDKAYAFKLSDIVYKYTKMYKIDSGLFLAILKQESNFKLDAKNCKVGVNENYEAVKVCFDFGISQVFWKTARRYQFDVERMNKDLDYSVNCGILILKEFKKRYGDDPDWFTRYNCGSRGKTSRETCQYYKKLIKRYY